MFLTFLKTRIYRLFKQLNPNEPKAVLPQGYLLIGSRQNLVVGQQVSFGGDVILYANEKIEIGEHSMIGMRTVIHTSTHDHRQHPMWRYRIDRPIRIGKHVWIGTSCIILAGVIIEDYAVVAAGAVVVANVPQGAIVGGNPARIIAYRNPSDYETTESIQRFEEATAKKGGYLTTWSKSSH